jgi:hypothetical protein
VSLAFARQVYSEGSQNFVEPLQVGLAALHPNVDIFGVARMAMQAEGIAADN